ncbi:MAG: hypothetical protein EHM64_14980 [Ignavibacteriae bacterium]|nr:MAG: hypothetical protein EHM64_14980 [Ignavibacteriota bacterium]
MKNKSAVYLLLLGLMITAFFIFTGGITDSSSGVSDVILLSNFSLKAASPEIYAKLPFSIEAYNPRHDKEKDPNKCVDEYYTARDLSGTLEISQQGSNAVVGSSSFIFVSEAGNKSDGFTGTFVDTISINNPGNYVATAKFSNNSISGGGLTTSILNFTVGAGSKTALAAGTYRLSTFKATCASGGSYTFSNAAASNSLVINADMVSASLNMDMRFGPNVKAQYPCLQDSSYNYSASGNFSVLTSGSSQSFKIEYENSAFVTFDFTFDGVNLILNYSKNGSSYEMSFVKQ